MTKETQDKIWRIVLNAIVSIITALAASSCTVLAMGRTPFEGLAQI